MVTSGSSLPDPSSDNNIDLNHQSVFSAGKEKKVARAQVYSTILGCVSHPGTPKEKGKMLNINKRRIFISLYFHDELSIGHNRNRLETSAYNWGILIRPKYPRGHDTQAFDITNGVRLDGNTMNDFNPNRDWYFRSNEHVNPANNIHLLGGIMVGKVQHKVQNSQVEDILRHVPLPVKGAEPQQNCVTWIKAAIQALQDAELAEKFDVDDFMTCALRFADRRMEQGGRPEYVNHTARVM